MGALHIVGHDLQLRLGVDAGPVREEQAAAELHGIGALGSAGHRHGAVEHAAAGPIGDHLVELVELALGTLKAHLAVLVGDLAPIHPLQGTQAGGGTAAALEHPRLQPRQGPTGHGAGEGVVAAEILLDRQIGQQHGGPAPLGDQAMAEASAGPEAGLQQHGGKAGGAGEVHLQELQAGLGFQDQQQPQGQHTLSAGGIAHQFKGGLNNAPYPQGQNLAGGSGGQQAAPGRFGAGPGRGVVGRSIGSPFSPIGGCLLQQGFQVGSGDRLNPGRQAHPRQRIAMAIQHQPHHPGRSRGKRGWHGGCRGQLGWSDRQQGSDIREAPGLLAPGGERAVRQSPGGPLPRRRQGGLRRRARLEDK